MSVITTVFLCYLVILIAVAAWSSRESSTLRGYFIAGKKLPPWVVAFSTNATGESGWLLLGLTGMGYAVGAHAFWVVLGEVVGDRSPRRTLGAQHHRKPRQRDQARNQSDY